MARLAAWSRSRPHGRVRIASSRSSWLLRRARRGWIWSARRGSHRPDQAGLEAELTGQLGSDTHAGGGGGGGNLRNGTRPKTVLTEVGPVKLDVPRDRDSSFGPQLVKKRQRRLERRR